MEVFNWTVEKGIATDAEIVAEVEKFKEYAFFDLCVRTAARTTPEVYEALRRLNDLLALNHATKGIKPIGNHEKS